MYIEKETIDKIKSLNLIDCINYFYSGQLKITNNHTRAMGLCPFHNEKSASFSIRYDSDCKAFRCFSCGKSGASIIDFVMLYEGLDFLAAVKKCCSVFNIDIKYKNGCGHEKKELIGELKFLDNVTNFYSRGLKNSNGLDYLKNRKKKKKF